MATVGLSQTATNVPKQSSSLQKSTRFNIREHSRQRSLQKQVNLLTEGLKIRDSQIASLKAIIANMKLEGKAHRTALTTESDYDPIDRSDIQLSIFPLSSTIDNYREQLQLIKEKYSNSCNVILELEAKLKTALNSGKNKEEQMKNQIACLREDLKYMKEQHSRNIDCLNIQMQHRQTERLKIVENRHKQQIEILNEQIRTLRQDNSEKLLEITRLNEKIKKQRSNNDGNVKFIENQNAELRDRVQKISIELKQDFRKRQEGMIAQFQVDLQLLHKEQAGEIKILCDRIRVLKSLMEQKQCQLKQLWKARNTQAQTLFSTKCETFIPKQKFTQDLQFSSIDKYLKKSR